MPTKTKKRSSEAQDRLPPHSTESEQAVLGAILAQDSVFNEALTRIPEKEAFYDLRHQEIWEAIRHVKHNSKKANTINVLQKLRDDGNLDAIGGYAYLSSLPDMIPTTALAGEFIDIILEKWMLRKLLKVCTEATSMAYDNNSALELVGHVQQGITACVNATTDRSPKQVKHFVKQAIAEMERRYDSSRTTPGLPTGFEELDRMTGGLHSGEMTIIGARTSVGKTALAFNIAEYLCKAHRCPVGAFSLEMTGRSLATRLIASEGLLDVRTVHPEKGGEAVLVPLAKAASRIIKLPLWVDDSSYLTISQLTAKARQMRADHGVELIIIDYLQLVRSDDRRYEKRYLEISDISKRLHRLANELDIPLLVLSQLSRTVDKQRPTLSDLSESSSIEQDADTVILMYRETQSDPSNVNIFVAKQRSGPTGRFKLKFSVEHTRFCEWPKIEERDIPKDKLPYRD